jgi:hypothetical protein
VKVNPDHQHRELLETLYGLREMIRGSVGQEQRRDLDRLIRVEGELLEVRFVRVEERLKSHGRLLGALGAALSVVAAALAVLAD